MIIAESTILNTIETGKIERQCRYFKATILESHQAVTTGNSFKNAIDQEETNVFTDKSTLYVNIADYLELHISEISKKKTAKETLKWVHVAISNAKINFRGNY